MQEEFEKRKGAKGLKTSNSCFSGKIVCGECGSFYGSKTWHSTSKYKKTIWRCNHKYDGDKVCSTPHLDEDEIKELFIKAFNQLIENKEEILSEYREVIKELGDTSKLEREKEKIEEESEVLAEVIRKYVEKNSRDSLNQDEYEKKYSELVDKYEKSTKQSKEIDEKILNQKNKFVRINEFIDTLSSKDELITEFDEELWNNSISKVIVYNKEKIMFYTYFFKKVLVAIKNKM